jgi:hypothetical protein
MVSYSLNLHVMICACTFNIYGLWYTHITTTPTQHSGTVQCFFSLAAIDLVVHRLKTFLQNK